ncbi:MULTISPECIES: hypothetical protein [unclassified Pseudomonas]|uniref:hypothetical protein n=1 Tax=unclassified Pseudomonas TaxID=196821 RepID=UPI002AC918BC|nr:MULTISPECIES: hypothetical protein [unclassified Pseudomonas]MEB0048497.1 hypothetical protein [Pseudomonas sp. Dout3]MEB0099360.1 hypothetical protein [Pseudomonas sp. DC1.2]WPX61174.1 hypothetical protein RHM68_11220 [Pseudomonas sp. DC1.2]
MRDDFLTNQVSGLACVYVSTTEHYQLDCFIHQYINTRNLRSTADISAVLQAALEDYPGRPPVMVNELNAWIDKTLGYRASHPDFPALEDV